MKKVYVVISYSSDGYGFVERCFSNLESAQKVVDEYNKSHPEERKFYENTKFRGYEIEELELED